MSGQIEAEKPRVSILARLGPRPDAGRKGRSDGDPRGRDENPRDREDENLHQSGQRGSNGPQVPQRRFGMKPPNGLGFIQKTHFKNNYKIPRNQRTNQFLAPILEQSEREVAEEIAAGCGRMVFERRDQRTMKQTSSRQRRNAKRAAKRKAEAQVLLSQWSETAVQERRESEEKADIMKICKEAVQKLGKIIETEKQVKVPQEKTRKSDISRKEFNKRNKSNRFKEKKPFKNPEIIDLAEEMVDVEPEVNVVKEIDLIDLVKEITDIEPEINVEDKAVNIEPGQVYDQVYEQIRSKNLSVQPRRVTEALRIYFGDNQDKIDIETNPEYGVVSNSEVTFVGRPDVPAVERATIRIESKSEDKSGRSSPDYNPYPPEWLMTQLASELGCQKKHLSTTLKKLVLKEAEEVTLEKEVTLGPASSSVLGQNREESTFQEKDFQENPSELPQAGRYQVLELQGQVLGLQDRVLDLQDQVLGMQEEQVLSLENNLYEDLEEPSMVESTSGTVSQILNTPRVTLDNVNGKTPRVVLDEVEHVVDEIDESMLDEDDEYALTINLPVSDDPEEMMEQA